MISRHRLTFLLLLWSSCMIAVQIGKCDEIFWGIPDGGLFHVNSNWQGGAVPGPADAAVFNLISDYVVQWNGTTGSIENRRLDVREGNVSLLATVGNASYTFSTVPDDYSGAIDVSGGTLSVGATSGSSLSVNATSSVIMKNTGNVTVGFGGKLMTEYFSMQGDNITLPGNSILTVRDGGLVATRHFVTGGPLVQARLEVDGIGSTFRTETAFFGGSEGYNSVTLSNGGLLTTTGDALLSYESKSDAFVIVGGGTPMDSARWSANSIYVGGTNFKAAGSAFFSVESGGTTQANSITVWHGGFLQVAGGTIETTELRLNGGVLNLALPANDAPSSKLDVTSPSSVLRLSGTTVLGGDLTLSDRAQLRVAGTTILDPDVTLRVQDAVGFSSSRIVNNGTIVASGITSLGNAARHSSYSGVGRLEIGEGAGLTLNDAGYADLGSLTELRGGTLIAPNGLTVPVGGALIGSGRVDARFVGATGSQIIAQGDLEFRETSDQAFITDGDLNIGAGSVRVNSYARLGATTSLGAGSTPGQLTLSGGATFDESDVLRGFGRIVGGPLSIEGTVQGNSPSQRITIESPVLSESGYFDNVTFASQFKPGLGPASLRMTDVVFSGDLRVDIGGTSPGVTHDYVEVWKAKLDDSHGYLLADRYGDYAPKAGDRFVILALSEFAPDGNISGQFNSYGSTFLLPPNLTWDIEYGAREVALLVVPLLTADFNQDHLVNNLDLSIWKTNYGRTSGSTLGQGDANADGSIDGADLLVWQRQLGAIASAEPQQSSVPEPSSAILFGIVVFGVGHLRLVT